MIPALLGTKLGMTQVLTKDGKALPVTLIEAGPCTVLQVKSADTDRYDAVQIGFLDQKPHRASKARIGHCGKAGTGPKRHIREIRTDGPAEVGVGDVLTVQSFADAEVGYVDVTGITRGMGFGGVMKRHGFGGQPASHGTERKHRSSGGIGGSAPRGRGRCVKKGKRMAGQMGGVQRTIRCQQLVSVDVENAVLIVEGGVPGPQGSLVFVRQSKTKA